MRNHANVQSGTRKQYEYRNANKNKTMYFIKILLIYI